MSEQGIIREIELRDVPELFRVRVLTRENRMTLDDLECLGINPSSISDGLKASLKGWLYEESGEVKGFAMGDRSNGEMTVIAMLPEAEGRGAGRELLTAVEDWLFGCGWEQVWLTTSVDQVLRAYGFYRRLGWVDWKIEDGIRYMRKAAPGRGAPPTG